MNARFVHWLIPSIAALAGWALAGWLSLAERFSGSAAENEKQPTAGAEGPKRAEWQLSAVSGTNTAPGENPTAAEALKEAELRSLFLAGDAKKTLEAFVAYARQNPARALDLAMTLEGPEASRLAMNLVLKLPATHGGVAMDVLKRHPAYLKACPVMDAVFVLCAKMDPDRAWREAHAPGVSFTPAAMRAFARGCAESNPVRGIELMRQIEDAEERMKLTGTVLREWTGRDSRAMLEWLRTQPDRDALSAQVPWGKMTFAHQDEFLAMAEMVPLEVLLGTDSRSQWTIGNADTSGRGWPLRRDWISAVKDEKRRAALYAGAARALLEVDPEQALPLVPELTDLRLRNRITSLVAAYRAATSPQEGFAFADSLTDAPARDLARRSVLATWSENDPAAAGAYLLEQGGPISSMTNHTVMNAWSKVAPEAAAQAVLQRLGDGGESAEAMMDVVMGRWVMDDAYAASKWVAALPQGAQRDEAVSALVTHSARREPEAALGWAQTVSDEAQRLSAMENTLQIWLRADRARAMAWLRDSPLDAATRSHLDQVAQQTQSSTSPSSSSWNSAGGVIVIY